MSNSVSSSKPKFSIFGITRELVCSPSICFVNFCPSSTFARFCPLLHCFCLPFATFPPYRALPVRHIINPLLPYLFPSSFHIVQLLVILPSSVFKFFHFRLPFRRPREPKFLYCPSFLVAYVGLCPLNITSFKSFHLSFTVLLPSFQFSNSAQPSSESFRFVFAYPTLGPPFNIS